MNVFSFVLAPRDLPHKRIYSHRGKIHVYNLKLSDLFMTFTASYAHLKTVSYEPTAKIKFNLQGIMIPNKFPTTNFKSTFRYDC